MDLVQDYEELERLLFPERTGDGPESFSGECCSLYPICDPTEFFQSKPFHPIMMDTVATIAQLVETGVYKELSPVSLLDYPVECY